MKKAFFLLVMVALLALTACAPRPTPTAISSTTSAPPATPAPTPTVPPTPMPTAEPRCPEPKEGTQLLTHEEDGYCFLYPDGLLRVDSSEHAVCLVPEGATQGCQNLVAAVEVTDAEGRTAAQIADDRMVREGGFGPERTGSSIAGVAGVEIPVVAGEGLTRELLFVREDRLYPLKFALPDPADPPEVGDALVHLFNTVTESFTWPPAVAAPGP